MLRVLKNLLGSVSGNMAMTGAIVLPVLLGAVGGMVDYHIYRSATETLQEVADGAALAATRESIIQGWDHALATEVARNHVTTGLQNAGLLGDDYTVHVSVDEEERRIRVQVDQDDFGYLVMAFIKQAPYIRAASTAQAVTDANVCVVGLFTGNRLAGASIHLDDRSRVDSPECGIYADSKRPGGFRIDNHASVRANVICSGGGFHMPGRQIRIDARRVTDCPTKGDPLRDRPAPSVGGCDANDVTLTTSQTLRPGVYCGGLRLGGTARYDLDPGVYIIKDGPLVVEDEAELHGLGVGFFLTGEGSTFTFGERTSIELQAPETGPMAGLLFYEDRALPVNFNFRPGDLPHVPVDVRLNTISSNDARLLVGTFYLPRSLFRINANAPVADRSAYTAIIAGRLWLEEGPTLVLNADYAATRVPVPDGIGQRDKGVRLVE